MSPAGRSLNSASSAGTTSLTKNHANTVNTQSADRRLRSNNNNNNNAASPLRHQTRRPSTSNTPTKSSKNNDLSQRIITILESVPSTISVSAHPSNSLPTNFSSLANKNSRSENSSNRRHSNQDQSDDEYNPEEMSSRRSSTSRFNGPIGGKPSSSFKRPGQNLKRGPKRHGSRRDSRQHSLTPSATTTNGMVAPSQVPSKMHFRARALDPLRQMPIQITKNTKKTENNSELEMLCNNKVLKRPLYNVPSGMEKEEEREHHLRKAIEAQKAHTSGTTSSDRFIPIPEVEVVGDEDYKKFCKWTPMIRTREYLPYKRDLFECGIGYDADEEDLEFLKENKFFISLDQYEKIIEKLEVASRENDVPSMHEFYQQHPELLLEHLERVYDFWISRRMKLIREYKVAMPLIPYVPSKNKLGEKDNNPYVAFRHRGPKVTTRRKQRLDAEHYGTILRLAAAIRRTHLLTKAMVERDTIKLKLAEKNAELFDEELEFLEQGGTVAEIQAAYPTDRQIPSSMPYANKWLSKVWNEVAREIFNNKPLNREENILAIATRYGPEDGRWAFHRNPACVYRMHNPADPNHQESATSRSRALEAVKRKLNDSLMDDDQFNNKNPRMDNESTSIIDLFGGSRSTFVDVDEDVWGRLTGESRSVFCRSRFGRGGRLKLDFLYK